MTENDQILATIQDEEVTQFIVDMTHGNASLIMVLLQLENVMRKANCTLLEAAEALEKVK
jgi:hypothetical protein